MRNVNISFGVSSPPVIILKGINFRCHNNRKSLALIPLQTFIIWLQLKLTPRPLHVQYNNFRVFPEITSCQMLFRVSLYQICQVIGRGALEVHGPPKQLRRKFSIAQNTRNRFLIDRFREPGATLFLLNLHGKPWTEPKFKERKKKTTTQKQSRKKPVHDISFIIVVLSNMYNEGFLLWNILLGSEVP